MDAKKGGGGGGSKLTAFCYYLLQPPSPFVDLASSMSSRFFDCKILFLPSLYFPTPLLSWFANAKKDFSEKRIIECKKCIKGTFS